MQTSNNTHKHRLVQQSKDKYHNASSIYALSYCLRTIKTTYHVALYALLKINFSTIAKVRAKFRAQIVSLFDYM